MWLTLLLPGIVLFSAYYCLVTAFPSYWLAVTTRRAVRLCNYSRCNMAAVILAFQQLFVNIRLI